MTIKYFFIDILSGLWSTKQRGYFTMSEHISPVHPETVNTWTGEYFKNRNLSETPVFTRLDNNINFNWGWGSPDSKVPSDNFSVRWTKQQVFEGGTYKFTFSNDDGMIMYIDNNIVYNSWKNQSASTKTKTINITQGTHILTVIYYENWGAAVAKVYWVKK